MWSGTEASCLILALAVHVPIRFIGETVAIQRFSTRGEKSRKTATTLRVDRQN